MSRCQMRQTMIRFAWILSLALCSVAGVDAGFERPPGLAGVRDAVRQYSARARHDDGIPINPDSLDDGTASKEPLRCLEVHHPVLTPAGPVVDERPVSASSHRPVDDGRSSCEVVLMDHSFGNSYGSPYVGQYQPPECAFNRVVLRLDFVSQGRQFDRLAVMYLGDIELWRTSTAEPKPSPGIVWTITKDLTPYLALWREPQTLIFDLGNLVNDKYTGAFNATLTATFFQSDVLGPNGVPADVILPISARRGAEGKASAFIYPETPAETVLVLPRNINRAVFAVSATGQAGEEFWWSNVPEKDKDIFGLDNGALPGLSSYREVKVSLDGRAMGFTWPYPVVFTGGVAPPLHRPVVGIQAFDLREDEIDVSPYLGVLCDGEEHEFSIDVRGLNDTDGEPVITPVPMHWVLTGKLFLWLDAEGSITTGDMPRGGTPRFHFKAETTVDNDTVHIHQQVEHRFDTYSVITTQQGKHLRRWQQVGGMNSISMLSDKGDTQRVQGSYGHTCSSFMGGDSLLSSVEESTVSSTRASYYINSDSTYKESIGDYDFSLNATLGTAMNLAQAGQHVFPNGVEPFVDMLKDYNETTLRTEKYDSGFFASTGGGNRSVALGDTTQTYKLLASDLLYEHLLSVSNETTIQDQEYVLGGRYDPKTPEIQDKAGDDNLALSRPGLGDSRLSWPRRAQKLISAWAKGSLHRTLEKRGLRFRQSSR